MKQFIMKCSAFALAVSAVSSAVVMTSYAEVKNIDSVYYEYSQKMKSFLQDTIDYAKIYKLSWLNGFGNCANVTVAYVDRNGNISDHYEYVLSVNNVTRRTDRDVYNCNCYFLRTNDGELQYFSGGTFTVFPDSVQIRDGSRWYFDSSNNTKVCLYCDLPTVYYNGSEWKNNDGYMPPVSLSSNFKSVDFQGINGNSLQYQYDRIYTKTIPTYTTPSEPYPIYINTDSSGSPVGGVPELWVYYESPPVSTFPIVEYPTYQAVESPIIPDKYKHIAKTTFTTVFNFFKDNGLLFLLSLSLFTVFISYILKR